MWKTIKGSEGKICFSFTGQCGHEEITLTHKGQDGDGVDPKEILNLLRDPTLDAVGCKKLGPEKTVMAFEQYPQSGDIKISIFAEGGAFLKEFSSSSDFEEKILNPTEE